MNRPSGAGYPAHLALWTTAGSPIDELTLDSLDLPPSLLSTMVRNMAPSRLGAGDSAPARAWRALRPSRTGDPRRSPHGRRRAPVRPLSPPAGWAPPESIGLRAPALSSHALPAADPSAPTPKPRWRRERWVLRNEYPLDLPGGQRTVHALVELRGPGAPLRPRVLVVLLDAAVLASLWFAAELVSGGQPIRPRWWSLRRSFRMRSPSRFRFSSCCRPSALPPGALPGSPKRCSEAATCSSRNASRCRRHRRGAPSWRRCRGRRTTARAEPAHRRRSRAVPRRQAGRGEHHRARRSRRDAAAHGSRAPSRRSPRAESSR